MKGQSYPLAILSMLGILIVGFTFINFILPEISSSRIDLNCADASNIHDGNKVLCLVVDSAAPYYIIVIISLVVGIVISRMRGES